MSEQTPPEAPEEVDAEVVHDAEVVPDTEAVSEQRQEASQEVVHAGAATGVLMPYDAGEVRRAMTAYQDAVNAVLDPSDWQDAGSDGRFLKKSGWRKIAKAFGLSVTRVEVAVERDAEGNPVRASAVYRATAPNGQSQDGDGYCSVEEARFQNWKGRQKLENDLRATATTRAKNRAISDLVGMGEVSAEEAQVSTGPTVDPRLEPFQGDLTEAWHLIEAKVGTDSTVSLSDWILRENGGAIPHNVGRVLLAVTRLLAPPPPTDTEPPEEAPEEAPEPDLPPQADAITNDDEVPF